MAFLDCMVWELNKFPRYGRYRNIYTISNVFHYCSDTQEYQNNNVAIQIPEFELIASKADLEFFYEYKKQIIEKRIPAIINLINNNVETWSLDLSKAKFLQHLTKRIGETNE